jgi:hypothetical protein
MSLRADRTVLTGASLVPTDYSTLSRNDIEV